MKLNKLLLTAGALALFAAPAMAQDFGDFGGFDDESSDESSSKLEVSGGADLELRAYVDADEADAIEMEATPSANLNLTYSGNNSDFELSLKLDEDTIRNHPEDVIDEALLRGRFGDYLTVEAGKMKVVWGKGDKLHVLDNFNADDYSDFIIPDYLDRRVSTPMVRAIVSLPVANLNIEGVYTPLLPTDRFATEGRWTPAQVNKLTGLVTDSAKDKVADAFTKYTTDTATAGTLSALNTDYLAAQEAYEKAYADMYNAAHAAGIANAVRSAIGKTEDQWNAMSDADKNTAIQTVMSSASGTAIEAGVTAALTEDAIKELLRTKGYGYYLDNLAVSKGKYDAACEETGFDAESIKDELTSSGEAYMLALTYANALSADPSVIYPDLWSLKYGQFGGRATWTLGQVDMGISYYNGWYKQPSFNPEKVDSFISAYLTGGAEAITEEDKFLAYDKKQTFGIEASSVFWHFNVRGELAYNLTDDTDGSKPYVHNNSVAWLGGFDIDLPFANANLNVQEIGSLILCSDECDENVLDVDYCKSGYTNNKIAVNLTTSFLNDKLAPEVTVMYGFERKDLVVMPKISYKADQNLKLIASGMIINCADDDSEFKAWEKNSFVSLTAEYQF